MQFGAAGPTADLKKTRCSALRFIRTGRRLVLNQTKRAEKPMADEHRSPNRGNFAEDREKASRAGRIGGQHSSGNFANNRERAAEAGRKGGQASHGATPRSRGAEDNGGRLRTGP
jgi:general stress protein YciG